jgi:hypothetical protein
MEYASRLQLWDTLIPHKASFQVEKRDASQKINQKP